MGSCNVPQNEKSGKDLIIKKCVEMVVDIVIADPADPELIQVASVDLEEVQVGDLVRFNKPIGSETAVTVGEIYFVVEVLPTGIKIASTINGSVIEFSAAHTDYDLEIFKTFAGSRSGSFSFNSEAIDISHAGTNQWKKTRDGAGMRSFSVSVSGVYSNSKLFTETEQEAINNALQCLAFADISTGKAYVGCFKATSFELTSEYDGEAGFSASFESSGAITIKAAVAA